MNFGRGMRSRCRFWSAAPGHLLRQTRIPDGRHFVLEDNLGARTISVAQVPDKPRQVRQTAANAMLALSHNSPTLCLLPIMRARLAIMAGVIGPV